MNIVLWIFLEYLTRIWDVMILEDFVSRPFRTPHAPFFILPHLTCNNLPTCTHHLNHDVLRDTYMKLLFELDSWNRITIESPHGTTASPPPHHPLALHPLRVLHAPSPPPFHSSLLTAHLGIAIATSSAGYIQKIMQQLVCPCTVLAVFVRSASFLFASSSRRGNIAVPCGEEGVLHLSEGVCSFVRQAIWRGYWSLFGVCGSGSWFHEWV